MTEQEQNPDPQDESGAKRPVSPMLGAMLADDDDAQDERGRIGYGRNERKSSWMLGLALVLVIAAIGIYSAVGGGDDDSPSNNGISRVGDAAPDFEMTTFEGETFRLSEHRGEVVIVNFWGSWCDPCREEMPAFQQASETSGDDVTFVGVGSKRDPEDKALAFAKEFGVTYPIGRDTEGGTAAAGQITKDFGLAVYPTTYIVDPDGNISAIIMNGMDTDDLASYIQQARDSAE